ncbi:enoyl-CoA hydratase/isomerase family protein [Actinomadura sp. NEAU-AAG7]|uniref:enoyl-CoA hydratase/isomerase family protein n=1 Tax=Actinomadura sp. NEAU-AAG7 TaxID=2839640 RepID=UPI001BE4863C|nr:enoyl-CoA hydratase/isomerase family protein [Actinomadura sp. NEAU-AAG7]MBT2208075.1 enoyl-CoA hydratase/isomerase family protein [Actinomadura sp. NEAU-AAG7]
MSAQSSEQLVLHEDLGDGVARITLNRPEKRNAMSRAARSALLEALDRCHGTARVIILTGAGTAFCSGVDLKEAGEEGPGADDTVEGRRTSWHTVQERIRRHPAIVIAAVNGFALGGGVTLANSADLAIAAHEARLGMPELGFGLYPGLAGPSTQLRLSPKRAAWMVLTTKRISGTTAAEWGLVNEAVPLADLADAALELARDIAQFDPVSLDWSKRALHEIPQHISDWTTALRYGEDVRAQIQARSDVLSDGAKTYRRAVGKNEAAGRNEAAGEIGAAGGNGER